MKHFLKGLRNDRRGNVLAITAAALPLVVGSAGLATDTIQWAVWKRQLQRAADSAALAGVRGLVAGQTPVGSCAASSPVGRDLQVNNHVLLGNNNTTCVAENRPTSGPWATDDNAVRVTLSGQRRLGFSSLFLSTAPTITATATATVVAMGQYCVISLEPTNDTGLTFQGNPTVNMGCGMATNSKGQNAVTGGGSGTVTASPIAAVGAIPDSSVFTSGTVVQPYSAPQPDPFADVNPPPVPSGCNQSAIRGNANSVSFSGGTVCYKDLTLSNGQSATFTDAVVILNGGDLTVNGGASLTCTRCTFVLTTDATNIGNNSIGKVTFNGGATIDLTAPTTGTYEGLVIYKDRRAPNCNNCNKINGNSSSFIQGGIYMPSQEVQFSGNSGMNTNCVQVVGRQVTFTGNTNISNTCPPNSGARAFDATTIRLVA